jgi:amino acid transporter
MPQAPALMALIVPGALVACWAGVLLAAAAIARSAPAIVAAGVAGIAPFLGILVAALIAAGGAVLVASDGGGARSGSRVDRNRLRGADRVSDRRWAPLLSGAAGHDARAARRLHPADLPRGRMQGIFIPRTELDAGGVRSAGRVRQRSRSNGATRPTDSSRRRSTSSTVMVIDGYSRTFP